MEKQFVTYEIAKQLKDLGFDEKCFGWWNWINGNAANFYDYKISNSQLIELNTHKNNCSAPLWQQVIDWLREEHKINIFFDCEMNISSMEVDWFKYKYKIYVDRNWINKGLYNSSNSYVESRKQAILKAIELINEQRINSIS